MPRIMTLIHLARWCLAMGGAADGRAFLSNFLFDCSYSRLPRSVTQRFLNAVATFWKQGGQVVSPQSAVARVTDSAPRSYYCMGPQVPTAPRECSRVMDARSFFTHNVDLTKARFFLTGHDTRQMIRMVEVLGLRGIAKNFMRTDRPFAWVTRTEAISELRRSTKPESLANRVRDLMGLDRLWQDRHLVEIIYPSRLMTSTPLTVPTSLDAGTSLVYRCDECLDGWGRTVNLPTLDRGLPEAVHPSVGFTDRFRIKYIGRIRPPRPSYDWGAFVRTMPMPWTAISFLELIKYV